MLFYFNVRSENSYDIDEEGVDLPTLEAARSEARKSAREMVAELVLHNRYAVLETEDAPAALRILQARSDINLLVTDVGLPNGMNGRQSADAVRGDRRDLTVLFVTGYAENAVLNHGHLERGMQVLTKPVAADTLARRVAELTGGDL